MGTIPPSYGHCTSSLNVRNVSLIHTIAANVTLQTRYAPVVIGESTLSIFVFALSLPVFVTILTLPLRSTHASHSLLNLHGYCAHEDKFGWPANDEQYARIVTHTQPLPNFFSLRGGYLFCDFFFPLEMTNCFSGADLGPPRGHGWSRMITSLV